MSPIFHYAIGLPAFAVWIWMLQESVASKIRNSKYWPLGVLAFFVLLNFWGEALFLCFYPHAS